MNKYRGRIKRSLLWIQPSIKAKQPYKVKLTIARILVRYISSGVALVFTLLYPSRSLVISTNSSTRAMRSMKSLDLCTMELYSTMKTKAHTDLSSALSINRVDLWIQERWLLLWDPVVQAKPVFSTSLRAGSVSVRVRSSRANLWPMASVWTRTTSER